MTYRAGEKRSARDKLLDALEMFIFVGVSIFVLVGLIGLMCLLVLAIILFATSKGWFFR